MYLTSNLKSNWEPQKNNHPIIPFVEPIDNDIEEEIFERKQSLPRNNISEAEKTILNEFLRQDGLVLIKFHKMIKEELQQCWILKIISNKQIKN